MIPTVPYVSVLMAAYNAERYIDQAIESLLAQTYEDWELVVVDDGSTDSTGAHLQTLAQRDSRIRLFQNKGNSGLGATRRKALALARGKYAAILDADDIALPKWLAMRVDYLEGHPEVALVSGSRIVINEKGAPLYAIMERDSFGVLRWRLLFGNPISHPGCMFRVGEARRVGGYRSMPYLEDWDLFTKLVAAGHVAQHPTPLIMYRVHPSSASVRVSNDLNRLQPIVTQIISRNMEVTLHMKVPEEIVRYLFRGRYVFRGSRWKSQMALDFVLQAHKAFVEQHDLGLQSVALAAAVLEDVANVLRCGGWSPRQVWKALSATTARAGIHCLHSLAFLKGMAKLFLIPLNLSLPIDE